MLRQYTNWDDKDIPESVIEAFVVKIVASKDGFDWYFRFNGNPDDPLHCMVEGKRKSTTQISVAGNYSPAIHKSDTGSCPGWQELSQNFFKFAEFTLTIDDAKEYVYSKSAKRRVYNWNDIKVRLYI